MLKNGPAPQVDLSHRTNLDSSSAVWVGRRTRSPTGRCALTCGYRRAETDWMTWRKLFAVSVALTAVSLAFALAAIGRNAASASVPPCAPHVESGVLPVWMRGGFGAEPRVTHAIGERGLIGAVLWNKPLYSPPAQRVNNKILWVPRHLAKSVAPLWIKMQKMDGTQLIGAPVRRIIATGPGPSLIDAPSAGCWRFTLTWSGQKDTLDVRYVPPTN